MQRKIYDQPTKAAIRWRQFKMIVSCDVGRAELYDLDQDPGERNDLFQSSPALSREYGENSASSREERGKNALFVSSEWLADGVKM